MSRIPSHVRRRLALLAFAISLGNVSLRSWGDGIPSGSPSAGSPSLPTAGASCAPESPLLRLPGVRDILFRTAPNCPSPEETLEQESQELYASVFPDGPKRRERIAGPEIEGTAAELAALRATLEGRLSSRWPSIARDCRTAPCAAGRLAGSEELGRRVLMFYQRTGYAFSLSIQENALGRGRYAEASWSPHEIREAEALSRNLPSELAHLPRLNKIYRVADGYRHYDHGPQTGAYTAPNLPGSGEHGSIVVYDLLANPRNPANFSGAQVGFTRSALLHEICHNYDFQNIYQTGTSTYLSESRRWGFRDLSNWRLNPASGEWSPGPAAADTDRFISPYARTSPAEDFAESCSAYVFAPAELQRLSPRKYALLKEKVFHGREYLNAEWNRTDANDWPALENALAGTPSTCEALYSSCRGAIGILARPTDGRTPFYGSDPVAGRQSAAERELREFPCIQSGEDRLLESLTLQLSEQPDFCRKGGAARVQSQKSRLCQGTRESLKQLAGALTEAMITESYQSCAERSDYTAECAQARALEALRARSPFSAILEPLVRREVQNRVDSPGRALGENFARLPAGEWISACLRGIGGVWIGERVSSSSPPGTPPEEIVYYRMPRQETFLNSTTLPYPVFGERADAANLDGSAATPPEAACAAGLQSYFESKGLKVPAATGNGVGSYRRAMANPAFSELWKDFEQHVLLRIVHEVRPRAFFKERATRAIIQEWVNGDPERRSALLTDENVRHLLEIGSH